MMKSRRDIIKSSALGLGLLSMAQFVSVNAAARRRKGGDAGGNLVVPGKGMAANVNYQHDKAKITDASLKKTTAGVAWDKQNCSNCVLYTAGKDGAGKCTLFPKQLVKANGWCTSWSKKP